MNSNDYIQKILISIDTETPAGNVESLIFGETRKGEYGISYLMDMFDSVGARGLFFVDFAEAWNYGKNKIQSIVSEIMRREHDVGVHLHPDHMADTNRRYLWEYSYEEQLDMIGRCTDVYREMTGKHPVSFRAGRYGADNNTIKILDELGYKYDMSFFYGNRRCKMDACLPVNRVNKLPTMKITEVPVTSFKSFQTPIYGRYDKVDCSMDIYEFKKVMKKSCDTRSVDVVSYFVHSFSLLNWRRDPENVSLNRKMKRSMEEQLNYINASDQMTFISESDIDDIDTACEDKEDNVLDLSNSLSSYWFFFKRGLKVMHDRMVRNV